MRLSRWLFSASSGWHNSSHPIGIGMSRVSALRTSIIGLVILVATTPVVSRATSASLLRSDVAAPPSNIVIGFVGGFVSHDNPHHGPVQLALRIRPHLPPGTYVRVFENRHRKSAYSAILNR